MRQIRERALDTVISVNKISCSSEKGRQECMLKIKDCGSNKGPCTKLDFSKKNLPRITAGLAVHRKSIQNQALPCGVISLMPLPHICHLCASPRITCQVRAAGISPGFPHGLGHGLDNLWLQGGGCVIVHVNPPGGKKRRWDVGLQVHQAYHINRSK